jgi:hypothetical protein
MARKEEALALLKAIGSYRAPSKLPEPVKKANRAYHQNGRRFTEEDLDALRSEFRAVYSDLKATTDVLMGLAALVSYLKEKAKDEKSAEQIAEIMRDCAPEYQPIADKLAGVLQDVAEQFKGAFDRFLDRNDESKGKAPTYDEAAPQGTVPLKDLKPVAAPLPQRPKKKK